MVRDKEGFRGAGGVGIDDHNFTELLHNLERDFWRRGATPTLFQTPWSDSP
ncbi:hypothetical protein [Pyrobaculum aerophilum]|uniref:Uncharacterized protein n=2 Tax=Pyrobaculum aerophilum TaxID=13773 RepID=Q8ZUI6_PYRAE|nr:MULTISPECIES: hypothetical protein [Pyrobaculum]AAL64421.1 hypothetical protein PAE2766 [Pyrobaculum aerophilum str. IM2]MCX8135584.1 hypothetical protein [Pyrobaculum aerophilum]HII47278.1 hypothetical protein [Pyrobaculum aerophilum]